MRPPESTTFAVPATAPSVVVQTAPQRPWRASALSLVLGALLAMVMLNQLFQQRRIAAEIGIDEHAIPRLAVFQGARLNVWQPAEYESLYPPALHPASTEGLWLGNSQLHTINQPIDGDAPAMQWASEALGFPVYGVSLNNANLQEHLVVLHWALARRKFQWLILPLCFDDLREDGIRTELHPLVTLPVASALAARPVGKRLADEIAAAAKTRGDAQGTRRDHRSLQDLTEESLERTLSGNFDIWAERQNMLGTMQYKLYQLRNRAFGIEATTKRRMIPLRMEKNMAALDELLEVAAAHQVRVLVYVVPLRWDPEPPYDLEQYRAWKQDLPRGVAAHGAQFADYDDLVVGRLWGLHHGANVDFMHFQGEGHRILGREVARKITESH